MPSFSTPLSGLNASSQEMTLIANNLANLNTPGFKASTASFSTLFFQSLGTSGDGDPIQAGTGTQIGSISMDFTDGSIDSTGIPSNAAIQGQGFFVVNKGGQQQFTRAGDFTVASSGLLQTADGSQVMGYPATNGVVDPNGALGPLQVGSGVTSPAKATANIELGLNLSATTAVGGTFSQPIQVFDSLGGTHTLTATFTKTAANTWNYNITLPGADTGAATPTSLGSGSVSFDSSGALIPANPGPPPKTDIALTSPALASGAAALNMTWHLFDAKGNALASQTSAASAPLSAEQDGNSSGNLVNFNIGVDGTITGSFSNGQTQVLGQIALATFSNPQGIKSVGGNAFVDTTSSGLATIGIPGTGSRGSLQGGAIEESNVDIASEFAKLIQAQRGYEASSHTVTTFDQVTQDTINMKAGN